jgi:hypothetical protein
VLLYQKNRTAGNARYTVFRMIESLALRSWQSVWQSTSRHQMEYLVLAGLDP